MKPSVPARMRALVYRGPEDLRLENVPVPRIGEKELLVKVEVCGVCPTDIKKIVYGTVRPPRIFGHETAGVIVRSGQGVEPLKVGDRVALHHHVPCGSCHFCAHAAFAQCPGYKQTGVTAGFQPAGGGFAEYVRVMPFVLPGVVKIPRQNEMVEGAMLEPVNTVLKAVRKLALKQGDSVLVAGQGPIGLMFNALLRLEGMRVVASDLTDARLKTARRYGAEKTFRADRSSADSVLSRFTQGRGLDAAVITVPADSAVLRAQEWLRGGGTLLLFGHTRRGNQTSLDLSRVCVDEKNLVGSYSADWRLQSEVARLVFTRKLDVRPLITDVYALEGGLEAIRRAEEPEGKRLKVVIKPA